MQYQELLQRQRDERAAFKVGETLEALGIGRERQDDGAVKPMPERAANENRTAEAAPVQYQQMPAPAIDAGRSALGPDERQRGDAHPEERKRDDNIAAAVVQIQETVSSDKGASIELSNLGASQPDVKAPGHGASDLAAGGIGALANYLADQLGEMFAPTPPEVREANAKAEAKAEANREAERPARDEKAAAYDAIIESAARALAEERERQSKGDAWWKERDSGKGFERDQ